MNAYVRPAIHEAVFLDGAGDVIDYGDRYVDDEGRDALTFERTNQDRFLPIFTVAQGLLDYLQSTYDVELIEDPSGSSQFDLNPSENSDRFVRVVHVKPASTAQPSIWVGFLNTPGAVEVSAGLFSGFDMWFCGCERCDDRWQDIADSLELVILSIAEKGLIERVDKRPWGRARYWLQPDMSREWSGSIPKSFKHGHFSADRSLLAELPNGSWKGFDRRG